MSGNGTLAFACCVDRLLFAVNSSSAAVFGCLDCDFWCAAAVLASAGLGSVSAGGFPICFASVQWLFGGAKQVCIFVAARFSLFFIACLTGGEAGVFLWR